MRNEVAKHDNRIDENERRHQTSTLIVDGLKRDYKKPLKQDLVEQLMKATTVVFRERDIAEIFVRSNRNHPNKPNSIQVRFKDIDLKRDLMKCRGMLKVTDIYIKEYLTRRQDSIFYETRRATKSGMLKDTWAAEGLVYATAAQNAPSSRIGNLEEIRMANNNYESAKRAGKPHRNEANHDEGHTMAHRETTHPTGTDKTNPQQQGPPPHSKTAEQKKNE